MDGDLPVSGRLRDQRLPKILTHLQRHKKTGVLLVGRNDQHKSLFIKDGDIIFATSKYRDDWLGEVLLKAGRITLNQYEVASEVTGKTRKRFGTVLVEQGVLTAKDLFTAVTSQVKDIILSLFTWLDGEYQFEEGPLPTQEIITLKMSTGNLILDGIRRINDFIRLRNELPPMTTILQITTDPLVLFQDIDLKENERKLLVQIDGKNTIYEIFAASELPAFETLKLLSFLLSIGLAEFVAIHPAEQPSVQAARTAPEPARGPLTETPSSSSSGLHETAKPGPVLEEQLLKEVKQEQQEAVVEGREQIFRPEQIHKDAQESQNTKQKIRQAYESLQHQDFYEVLGLEKTATRDQIKRAYFHLAKEYHPDRHFQAGLEELTPQLEALFRGITEAYDTLLMERKRQDYDTKLAMKKVKGRDEGAAGPSLELQVQTGQQAFRKGDFKTAAYYFETVVKAAPTQASYHLLLAKTLTQVQGRQRDAETHYKMAIELDPSGVDHYLGLGLLYKKSGMIQRAQRQFEEALIWDPENKTAKEELRKLQP
ncbi:MAG: DnaJ domain-containing protein [Nitrospirae bacterium]|nr:DnaJ domain-containing protein [Nitrospirota bacterium]